jgi:hypothetical protein
MPEVRHLLLITLVHGTLPRGFFPKIARFKQWVRRLIQRKRLGPPPFWFEEGSPFLARLSTELRDIPHKIRPLLWSGANSIFVRDKTAHASRNIYRLNMLNIRRLLNSSLPTVTEAISLSAVCTFCTSLTALGYARQTGRTRLL